MPTRRNGPDLKLLYGVDPNELDRAPTPQPSRHEPAEPEGLTGEEQTLWRQVTAELREMGQLSAADTCEILAYVRTALLAEHVHAELADSHSLSAVNLNTGVRHANPLLAAYDRAVGRAHTLASGLGLNPHGRSLIHGRRPDVGEQAGPVVRDLYGA